MIAFGQAENTVAEAVAQSFHEAYERLAPEYGYETRKDSAVPWADVPEPNRSLMIAVAGEVLAALASHHRSSEATFHWTREEVGLLIDGMAHLVSHENRGGPESKILRELQDAYRAAAAAGPEEETT